MESNILLYGLAFLFSLGITFFTVRKLIPALKTKAAQPIYEEGPNWHLMKAGTPTMGGLGYLIAISLTLAIAVIYLFFTGDRYSAVSLLLTAVYGALNSLIGVIDDIAKIRKKENAGLSPLEKLILQTLCAVLFLTARTFFLQSDGVIRFSFGSFDMGFFYFPLALFMLLGTVNAANLTDGIDGIASAVAFTIGAALTLICKNASDVSFTSFCLMGAAIGFLIYNLHPAKIFMGDTGSLYLGSLIGACCISIGNPLIILLSGSVYFVEAISVIIQVVFYKLTKKRVFKMAPFHHHLEKCGFEENKIVICAVILTLISSVAAFFITV